MPGELIIIGIILLIILWTAMEQKQLVITSYQAVSDRLPRAFHDTGFVVLADLHNVRFGKHNQRLLKRIESCSPEFIIIAGDMIQKRAICYPGDTFSLLEQLAKKHRIYYAYGNHEQTMEQQLSEQAQPDDIGGSWNEFKAALVKCGVSFLDNQSVWLQKGENRLRITGVSIGEQYFGHGKLRPMDTGYLTSLLGNKPESEYQILIAHNPSYFQDYCEWGADLILSGHLHGGMVRLPFLGGLVSPQVRLFPKYSAGFHKRQGHRMAVSRGLGSHSLMPRLFNTPEIVQIILKNSELTSKQAKIDERK